LVLGLSTVALADTIRMKDGSIYKGKVIGFKDQQFTILVGNAAQGRQSRLIVYVDDIESIEFDSSTGSSAYNPPDDRPTTTYTPPSSNPPSSNPTRPPANSGNSGNTGNPRPNNPPSGNNSGGNNSGGNNSGGNNSGGGNPSNTGGGNFFPIKVRVTGDNTTNGWTSTGFVVRKGQRLRITATGRVMLGQGRSTTPAGISTLPDPNRLMPNEPTGALIAVIGDNNNDFLFIGARREFVAAQDGYLFLGVNENNLDDNTGAFDATLEVESGNGP
jgi:hypothetical protein